MIDSNEAISPQTTIGAGYQVINGIYLDKVALGDTPFDNRDIGQLYAYAFMCPLEGGEATYRARAMLSFLIDTFYLDDNFCVAHDSLRVLRKPIVKDKQKGKSDNENAEPELCISMHPNPANNYVILLANKELQGQLQLRVTDAIGKTVVTQQVNLVNGRYTLDTVNLVSGLYLVTLFDNNSKLFGGKLSIFR